MFFCLCRGLLMLLHHFPGEVFQIYFGEFSGSFASASVLIHRLGYIACGFCSNCLFCCCSIQFLQSLITVILELWWNFCEALESLTLVQILHFCLLGSLLLHSVFTMEHNLSEKFRDFHLCNKECRTNDKIHLKQFHRGITTSDLHICVLVRSGNVWDLPETGFVLVWGL